MKAFISALVFAALLSAAGCPPTSAAHPAFPADNDTLTYEIRGQDYVTYQNGSRVGYPIEIDLSHRIVNHTGSWYFANVSLTLKQPAIMLPLNVAGTSNWTALVHYYANNGDVRRLYIPDRLNWSELSETFTSDLLYIPQQTIPGQTVYWIAHSGDSHEWTEVGFPAELGPPQMVGAMALSTVGMLLNSRYKYNGTVTADTDVLSFDFSGEGYWEWSLGFLTRFLFDYTEIVNPNCTRTHDATRVDIVGTCRLVNYTLAGTPIPYVPTMPTTPLIPGFPVEAVLTGLLFALVPLLIIRKRRQ